MTAKLLSEADLKRYSDIAQNWAWGHASSVASALLPHIAALTAQLDAARQEAERAKQQLAAISAPGEARPGREELGKEQFRIYAEYRKSKSRSMLVSWGSLLSEVQEAYMLTAEALYSKGYADALSQHRQQVAELEGKLRESEHTSRDFCEKWQIEYQRTNEQTRKLTAAEQELAQLRQRADGADVQCRAQHTINHALAASYKIIEAELDAAKEQLSEAQRNVESLNAILREQGHGQGEIDSWADSAEENERLKAQLATLKTSADAISTDLATCESRCGARERELERARRACEPFVKLLEAMRWVNQVSKKTVIQSFECCGAIVNIKHFEALEQAALPQPAPTPSPEPEAPKAEQERPAFVCPKCGVNEHGSDGYQIYCLNMRCNWSGTWSEVAAAKATKQEPTP